MESMFNLTPVQSFLILGLNVWIFIVFPIIVLKKINRLTDLFEAQYSYDEQED